MSWGKEIDEAVAMAKAPLRDYVAWLLHVAAPPSRETLEVTASRKFVDSIPVIHTQYALI